MLVSFEERLDDVISKFDAHTHFKALCEEQNVSLASNVMLSYKFGWIELIARLIDELKCYPIKIRSVDDSHGQLDIKFEMLKQRREVYIWRLLESYKEQSHTICMGCGAESNRIKTIGLTLRLCPECYQSAAVKGKTGTWLDMY